MLYSWKIIKLNKKGIIPKYLALLYLVSIKCLLCHTFYINVYT